MWSTAPALLITLFLNFLFVHFMVDLCLMCHVTLAYYLLYSSFVPTHCFDFPFHGKHRKSKGRCLSVECLYWQSCSGLGNSLFVSVILTALLGSYPFCNSYYSYFFPSQGSKIKISLTWSTSRLNSKEFLKSTYVNFVWLPGRLRMLSWFFLRPKLGLVSSYFSTVLYFNLLTQIA